MLVTANQPFGEWGKVFPDPAMTVAAVDRLVHHSRHRRDERRELSAPRSERDEGQRSWTTRCPGDEKEHQR